MAFTVKTKKVKLKKKTLAKSKQKGLAPGCNTILDKRLIKRFSRFVKRGIPAGVVCDYLGIHPSTFWFWIQKGQKYVDSGNTPFELHIYGLFVRKLKRCSALYVMSRVGKLHTSPYWARELAILERRDRRNFGRNEPQGGTDEAYDVDERFA